MSFATWIHINFYMPIWYLKVILFISYVFTFINKFLPECFFFTIWVLFFNHFLFTRHAQWPVVIEANLAQKTVSSESRHWTEIMIPPNASLVKYDNPVLVSRNTDKKTPRVCFDKNTSIANQFLFGLYRKLLKLQPSIFTVMDIYMIH